MWELIAPASIGFLAYYFPYLLFWVQPIIVIYKTYQILTSVHNLIRFLVSGCKVKNSLPNNQTKSEKSFKFLIFYQNRDIGPTFPCSTHIDAQISSVSD